MFLLCYLARTNLFCDTHLFYTFSIHCPCPSERSETEFYQGLCTNCKTMKFFTLFRFICNAKKWLLLYLFVSIFHHPSNYPYTFHTPCMIQPSELSTLRFREHILLRFLDGCWKIWTTTILQRCDVTENKCLSVICECGGSFTPFVLTYPKNWCSIILEISKWIILKNYFLP